MNDDAMRTQERTIEFTEARAARFAEHEIIGREENLFVEVNRNGKRYVSAEALRTLLD